MNNKIVAIIGLSIGLNIIFFLAAITFMTISKDLTKKVGILEQSIIDYKWQLEQVSYVCECGTNEQDYNKNIYCINNYKFMYDLFYFRIDVQMSILEYLTMTIIAEVLIAVLVIFEEDQNERYVIGIKRKM